MSFLNADEYFSTARERYLIHQRRNVKLLPPPWTEDPVFQEWRFCNVHREDDKTTIWFRENVRKHLSGFAVLEATVIFRWFNRIETGERILDLLLEGWNTAEARRRLTGFSPVVTGAYIIKGYDGYDKLNGVLRCIDEARPKLSTLYHQWVQLAQTTAEPLTLQRAWQDLRTLDYMGGFMAYEVVSDLRWTDVLCFAPDINTWANAGPGCARGLGWLVYNDSSKFNASSRSGQAVMLDIMQQLLALSRDDRYWPREFTPWEMRECEHWSCEYDKYKRAQRGDRMKRKFTI